MFRRSACFSSAAEHFTTSFSESRKNSIDGLCKSTALTLPSLSHIALWDWSWSAKFCPKADPVWSGLDEEEEGDRNSEIQLQCSAVTVTPSGMGKSVTVTNCHSNSSFLRALKRPMFEQNPSTFDWYVNQNAKSSSYLASGCSNQSWNNASLCDGIKLS